MSDDGAEQRLSTADQAGAADDQTDAFGDQITQASDALYRAFKVFEESSSGSCDSDYRVHFFNSFRLVTTAVATADGALSPERSTAIDQIFWLDRPDAAAQAQVNSATPDQIEATVQRLCAMATSASRFAAFYSKPADAASNPLVVAADLVFGAVLAAGPGQGGGAGLAATTVDRLKAAVPEGGAAEQAAAQELPPTVPPSDPEPLAEQPALMLTSVACPARLHAGETCYAVTDASFYQDRKVTRGVRYAGLSARVRLARGVSFNTGAYGVDRISTESMDYVTDGTLCITDQRLIFLSGLKNLDLPFARLLACGTGIGTILLARSNGGGMRFDQLDAQAVAVFEQLSGTSPDNRLQAEAEAASMQAIADREEEVSDDAPDPVSSGAGATLAVVVLLALIVIGIVLWRHPW